MSYQGTNRWNRLYRIQEICSWDGNWIQSSWVFIQYLLTFSFLSEEFSGHAACERAQHHQQNLCTLQNPFFSGKAERFPKQPPLSTLWSVSSERAIPVSLLSSQSTKSKYFLRKMHYCICKEGSPEELELFIQLNIVNSYWIILTA